ncbi:MAG: ABC transporter permease [Olivibacter sp.]|jgi:predicted permease|nr:ABC transporter permease [Olivibacter sp. UJ_SKK_5.1]
MIKHYFKTALRNLWRTRSFSFLNIFGLAVGIATASLIFLWIEDEAGYDKDFPNNENIYITKSKQPSGEGVRVFDAVSGLLSDAMKAEIPGVKYSARADWGRSFLFTKDERSIYQNGQIVDPEFMDIFSLEFVEGNRSSALVRPDQLVITQSAANRIFGQGSALGKTVRVNNDKRFVVSGVVKDLPRNSSIQFDWLISFEEFEKDNAWVRDWGNSVVMTYVQLEPAASLANVNKRLFDLVKRQLGNEQANIRNFLYPMERWRLYNNFDKNGNEQDGRMKYIRLFSIIAWVILLIACINFTNLTTARSEKRAKEVGMRKVAGARRVSLIGQFLGESLILATISALLAMVFIYSSIGAFNALVGKELVINLFKPAHQLFLISIVLICGLLSGIYPAFYLASFNPISTLKGAKQRIGSVGFIRRGLVVLQYAASVTLIICTVIIFQQIRYAKGRDLGFDLSQVLTVPLRGEAVKHSDLIKEQLLATGRVESVGAGAGSILNFGVRTDLDWTGKDPNQQIDIFYSWADEGIIPAMGLELVDGRNFRPHIQGDSSSFLVNETFAKLISADGKVAGRQVFWEDEPFTIIGVVKDFVYNDVYSPTAPVFFRPYTGNGGMLSIKIKAGADLAKTVEQIEQVMKANNKEFPFEYQFLDEAFNEKFKSEMLLQKLGSIFAVLSIIISCLGLFGLAAFTAERRTKELGIRKVLGASISSLISLLNREFVILVLISCLVSFPLAWWVMNDWLDNFAYRTDLHWWVFAFTGLGALILALITVSSQAIKTALTNPTKSLREE